jgi:hypothetical protein
MSVTYDPRVQARNEWRIVRKSVNACVTTSAGWRLPSLWEPERNCPKKIRRAGSTVAFLSQCLEAIGTGA